MSLAGRFRRGPVLSGLVATVVTVGCAYLAVRDVDFDQLGESLRTTDYWLLLPALAVMALSFFTRALRWRFLFSPGNRPAVRPTTEALLVGQFFNNVLPFRAGDAIRIVALHSLGGRSRAETTGTVLIERVLDVLSLLLLLFVALPVFPEVGWLRAAGALAIAVTVALVAAVVVVRIYGERPLRFALRPVARLPFFSPRRVEAAVGNMMRGLVALRSARIGLVALAWTTLSWLLLAVSFWIVMLGSDLGLSPAAGLLAVIATSLSLILPSGPAALGVFEAAAVVALAAYGVPRAEALSYGLVIHAFTVLPFIAVGVVLLNVRREALQPSRRRAARGGRGAANGRDPESLGSVAPTPRDTVGRRR